MRVAAILGLAVTAALASGCGSAPATGAAPTPETTLTVSAASSLTEAFTSLAAEFEAEHPGVDVALNFAGSSALAEQVNAGAPVDVLATASRETMATVVEAGTVTNPQTFARNELAVIAPAANEAGIESLADLERPGVLTAICAPDVPCGAAAATLLERNGVVVSPATLDPDVKSVLARVVTDEVDAGIVYVSDARSAGDAVTTVPIPSGSNVSTDYQLAAVAESAQSGLAREFVALVTGDSGRQALASLGFLAP
jgi:molybdate transport system substrate-binding protein